MMNFADRMADLFPPSRPFVFILLTYLSALLFFAGFRLAFLIVYAERFTEAPLGDLLYAFLIGVRFDQIVILLILSPLVLLLPWLPLRLKPVRLVSLGYLTLIFSACFLMLVGDIPFYKITESHLNYMALDYLAGGRTARHLVLTEPGAIWYTLAWLVSSLLFSLLLFKILRWTKKRPHRKSWLSQIIFAVLLILLSIGGVRGRLGLSPMRWGVAAFSANHNVNQLGLNAIWSFFVTIEGERSDGRLVFLPPDERFAFVPFDQALKTTQRMLSISDSTETWLAPDSSVSRHRNLPESKFDFKPNVVVVLMESWSGRHTGALGSELGLTPHFDSLAAEGILFTNFYANGVRTNYGLAASLCSAPALPGRPLMKRYNVYHPFRSLSEILHERGYYNLFAYGGDKVFDNIEGFFTSKAYDQVYGDDDFGRELDFAKWGIPDHLLFDQIIKLTDSLPRPFQVTILTLSNHEPFDLPDSSVQIYPDDSETSKIRNAFAYADFALGHFIKNFAELPAFDSTIFLFVADHARSLPSKLSVDPRNYHIPLLIYSPVLLGTEPIEVDLVGGQIDIIPTLISLLGGDYTHESWGRDLLAVDSSDPGWALMEVQNRIGFVSGEFFYLEPIGQSPGLYLIDSIPESILEISADYPEDFLRIQQQVRHFMQTAEQLITPGSLAPLPGLDSSIIIRNR